MADPKRWPFVNKFGEWSVMPSDRRRKQFPYRVAIVWPDTGDRLGDKLTDWFRFCTDTFGEGTRDSSIYMKKKWKWTFFTSHSGTEQTTVVIFAFKTEADLIVFKMGVMSE